MEFEGAFVKFAFFHRTKTNWLVGAYNALFCGRPLFVGGVGEKKKGRDFVITGCLLQALSPNQQFENTLVESGFWFVARGYVHGGVWVASGEDEAPKVEQARL